MENSISLAEIQARPLPPGFETISGPLPHSLLNDLMFRIVFETNQEALKSLLCSLLHLEEEDIAELVITNPIRLGETPKQKQPIIWQMIKPEEFIVTNLPSMC